MSQNVHAMERSFKADADLSAKQYFILKVTSTGVDVAGGATQAICGILQNEPKSGEQATVQFLGTSKVKAGGTVSIGDWITTNASGKAIATTTAGDVVIGQALESAAADDVFEIRLVSFKY